MIGEFCEDPAGAGMKALVAKLEQMMEFADDLGEAGERFAIGLVEDIPLVALDIDLEDQVRRVIPGMAGNDFTKAHGIIGADG